MTGVDADLVGIGPETARPTAHPQLSVRVDQLGDVHLYREAAFPGARGADRHRIDTAGPGATLSQVAERSVTRGEPVAPAEGDEHSMDGCEQVVTARLNQLEADVADGWGSDAAFSGDRRGPDAAHRP